MAWSGTLFKPAGTMYKPAGNYNYKLAGAIFKLAGTIHKLAGTIFKPAGTIYKLAGTIFRNWAARLSGEFQNLPGLMSWPDVFIILPSALPKFKMCTSLTWSGLAKLSFAASQWPEHLIEPMPNYLGHDSTT